MRAAAVNPVPLVLVVGFAVAQGGTRDEPDFARDVAPILERHCVECHGRHVQKAGLRLDQRAAALAGSDFGRWSVIEPGDRELSVLYELAAAGDMPPAEDVRLSPDEVELLGAWIDAGAPWPDDGEPAAWPTRHWAYAAPERPTVPAGGEWSQHPVDVFLEARMAAAGLEPSPPAEPRQLLRRASLDLTGLPPTEAEYEAFLADAEPGAWERALDRLLASPHYGEQQARRWLDLARYADSNGYEKDGERSVWPWRDWVVGAFNGDKPYDAFTIEQLAGDLLPDATLDQRLATGFHRNTMTNEEGGTDAEEFRVAAVVDRVNTTGEVWLGTTMGCAQCHDHKFDPVTQADYFRMFAVFNQTADDGRGQAPSLAVPTPDEARRSASIDAELAAVRAGLVPDQGALSAWAAGVRATLTAETGDRVRVDWFDGVQPPARSVEGAWRSDGSGPRPLTRGRAVVQSSDGFVQDVINGARAPLTVGAGDRLYAVVWIDPERPPRELLLQWHSPNGGWEHRALWGEDLQPWGTSGTPSRLRLGEVPTQGGWIRLDVDAAAVGFDAGDRIDGLALGVHSGRAWWDSAGIESADPRVRAGVPDDVADALLAWEPQPAATTAASGSNAGDNGAPREAVPAVARDWFVATDPVFDAPRARVAELEAARPRPVTALVLAPAAERRTTHVLERGSFLSPGAVVEAGVPAVLDPQRRAQIDDRLDFARWLVSDDNPLTARVTANRLWMWTFGTPLVATPDDFGTYGAAPTHPELLDWLAAELVERDWSLKAFYRLLMTSAAYRQAAVRHTDAAAVDPTNRLLSWFPRRRLAGEELRDQALALAGSLDRSLGGPPVFPPQPAGIDNATYAGDRWRTSSGGDAHRRGLYTFWRRTSPYPTFLLFDAPSRELSCARRDRSNTPLQALALLNDPNFVAASEAFGERLADRGLDWGFRACTGREADAAELAVLEELRAVDGWSAAAQVLLNLDETVTRP